MVLLDEVLSVDENERSLVASATIREEWRENWSAIELMAQAAAALAGVFDRVSGSDRPARPGFLLGTRRIRLAVPSFEVGRTYLVTAKDVFSDAESASFECTVRDGDAVVASAILNAYRPDDVVSFLAEQRSSSGKGE
jgi:predicted hotdog family 3-hydroxylacyl-ACP dehydratase